MLWLSVPPPHTAAQVLLLTFSVGGMRNGSETAGWRRSDDTVAPGQLRFSSLIKNDAIRFNMSSHPPTPRAPINIIIVCDLTRFTRHTDTGRPPVITHGGADTIRKK